ncbi:class I SAM-dependent methyltransferase [Nocardioides sp.]|uniref:class I SAM-dependent DNA methyltransferase n=1 Tax=Nocardioides sp. TaxID=35761 RepID=UPI0035AF4D1D
MSGDWAPVYDALAPTYDESTGGDGWAANEHTKALLAPLGLAPATVLDLGAGTGQTALMLDGLYPRTDLTLVDPSLGMLAQAPAKVPGAAVVVDDAAGFLRATDGSWDLITAVGFLELVPDLFEVLRLAASRLRPGGHLAISHEPLLPGSTVQARPVSVVGGSREVRRHPREDVERHAASFGLERVASHEAVAFPRGDADGDAVYEFVVWAKSATVDGSPRA